MKNILSILLAAFLQLSCTSQEVVEKSKSLEPILKTIKTIDPKDEDFSDLQFLKKIIERDSVQIIMLGEQTHGDGSTFLAKTRLIKFLYKEAGFDVLAFESGLFDCTYAWDRIKQNRKYYDEIRRAVFPMWVGTKECEELLDYLQSTLTTSRPLELSGFDSRITGDGYNNCSVFCEQMKNLVPDLLTINEDSLFEKLACLDEEIKNSEDITYNLSLLDKVCNKFDSLAKINNNYEYWRNVVYGVRTTYKRFTSYGLDGAIINSEFNGRDIQMGNNLVWLSKNKYKKRKIIVWAASFHNFRRLGELVSVDEKYKFINEVYKKTITMGDVLYDSLGSIIYLICFIQYFV